MGKYIYLVLSRTGTLLNKAIMRFGHLEYGHISVSLDPTLTRMYSFGRIYPKFPLWGGFVEENIHEGIYEMFSNSECLILQISISEENYKKIEVELERFKEDRRSYRYNFIGIFGLKAGVAVRREKAYFCSQFVSTVLSRVGIWDKNPGLTTPVDFLSLNGGRVLYRGKAMEYPG